MKILVLRGRLELIPAKEIVEGRLYYISNSLQVKVIKAPPRGSTVQCSGIEDESQTISIRREKLLIKGFMVKQPYTHKIVFHVEKNCTYIETDHH